MKGFRSLIKLIIGELMILKIKWLFSVLINSRSFLEEKKMQKIRRSFYGKFIRSDDLCIDVGANIGNRIQPLLDLKAKVIAVEPQQTYLKYLNWRFKRKIAIVPLGLGEKEGIRDFYISDAPTISSFSKEWIESVRSGRFSNYNWNKIQKIQITTLDRIIRDYGIPTFIKIDVEGYELEVLRGLNTRINMISYEYTVPEQTTKAIDCLKSIYRINNDIECNYSIGESMNFILTNWLSYHEMISLINTNEFKESEVGDIYVRDRKFGQQLN